MRRLLQVYGCLGGMLAACTLAGCEWREMPARGTGETGGGLVAANGGAPSDQTAAGDAAPAPHGSDSADADRSSAASAPAQAGGRAADAPSRAGTASSQVAAARRTPPTATGTQEVTFDTIKLPLEKDQPFNRSVLTQSVLDLDGKDIRIRGYILPTSVFRQTGITQFVLVRDNQQCCFGPGAALHDCIVVEMKPGNTADYTIRPVSVEGKFTLAEMVNPDDGRHLAIYHLDGEKVQ